MGALIAPPRDPLPASIAPRRSGEVAWRLLLLTTAAATTAWLQLPLLPAGLLGQGAGTAPLAIADLLLAATVIVGLILSLGRRKLAAGPRPLAVAAGLVVGAAALGAASAPDPLLAWATTVQLALLWLLFSLIVAASVPHWQLAAALLSGLALHVPLVLLQGVRQNTWPAAWFLLWPRDFTPSTPDASVLLSATGGRWLRPYGLFFHPNILGGYLAIALVVLVGAWLAQSGPLRRPPGPAVGGAIAGLAIGCLVLSASRGAWLGALAGLAALGFGAIRAGNGPSLRSMLVPILIATLVAAAIVALVRPPLFDRFDPGSNRLERQSVQERLFANALGVRLLRDHLALGVGAGNVDAAELADFHGAYTPVPMHNVPLLMAVELGPLGALAWALAAVSILRLTWRQPGRWTLVFAAALVVVGTAGLFDHYFWRFSPARTTVTLLAAGWAVAWRAERTAL